MFRVAQTTMGAPVQATPMELEPSASTPGRRET